MSSQFERDQSHKGPVVKVDLTGKVVIVTGANTGIGYEAAKHFALMNPKKLILACRSQARGEAALESLTKETRFDRAELMILNLSSFASVKAFADKFNAENERLDILLENAGVTTMEYNVTEDGWEECLQANNLAPELLTLLLLPKIIKTQQDFKTTPRIVVVSSDMHLRASLEEELVKSTPNLHKYFSSEAYHKSIEDPFFARYIIHKAINVFFARALHTRLRSPSSIIINSANPGYTFSELRRNAAASHLERFDQIDPIAYTTEEGARHLVFASVAHEGEQTLNDVFASVSEVQEFGALITSELGAVVQQRLWDELIQILSEVDSRVPEIVGQYLKA